MKRTSFLFSAPIFTLSAHPRLLFLLPLWMIVPAHNSCLCFSQKCFTPDLQRDHAAFLAAERDLVNDENEFILLQGIDEVRNLGILAGHGGVNVNFLYLRQIVFVTAIVLVLAVVKTLRDH